MRVCAKTAPKLVGGVLVASFAMTMAGGNAAQALDVTKDMTLDKSYTEQLVIKSGSNVTLDLGGYNITTDDSNKKDAIYVEYGAILTIKGEGTVTSNVKGGAAVFNNGTTTIDGGTFYKDDTKYGWYNVLNHGIMTINDGTFKMNNLPELVDGVSISSMMENGYYNHADNKNERNGYIEGVNHDKPTLTINGGVFDGGRNTVKNDDNGILTIKGGEFTNTLQMTVMNWAWATIEGGTFNVKTGQAALANGSYGANTVDPGVMTIIGGTFNSKYLLGSNLGGNSADQKVDIKGGTFNVEAIDEPNAYPVTKDSKTITGGTFTDKDIEVKPAKGYANYLNGDGDTVVLSDDIDFDATAVDGGKKTVGDTYKVELDATVLANAKIAVTKGEATYADGVLTFTKAGTVELTVTFNGESKVYTFAAEELEVTAPREEGNTPVIAAPNTGVQMAKGGLSVATVISTFVIGLAFLAGIRLTSRE